MTAYAQQVSDGVIPAGKWHRLSCDRHLRDLRDEGSRWVFRPELADKAFGLFGLFRHFKGEWAGQTIRLEPFQQFIVGSLMGWVDRTTNRRRFRNAFVELPRGNGKALCVSTPVPTPTGWTKHGDLKPGDKVFAPDGAQVTVEAVTPHYEGPCLTLETSDGAVVCAHERHEWDTHRTWYTKRPKGSRKPLPPVETREIAATLRCGSRRDYVHRIDVTRPLVCDVADLPVPPYTLGAWLGDGHSASARLTSADPEIVLRIRSEGIPVRKLKSRRGAAKLYALSDGDRSQKARNVCVAARLGQIGVLNHKHIPTSYLRASIDQRLELLRGLIDTDGHVSKAGQIELCLTNQHLAHDAFELVGSLGHKPTMTADRATLNGREVGNRYRIQFWQIGDQDVATLPRKRARIRPASSIGKRRTVVFARTNGSWPVNCIQVQGGKYLAGKQFVPTRNSTIAGGLLVMFGFFLDEGGAEAYSVATKKDQARISFQAGRQMLLRSRTLKKRVEIGKYNVSSLATESKMEALGADADTLDGLRPFIVVVDEVHKLPSSDLIDVMESGMGTRLDPLLFEITTAGADDESVYGQHFLLSTRVLDQTIPLDEWFAFIASADPEDDWTSETTWRKANPNYGVSVKPEFLDKEVRKALANPAEQPRVRRLYLGQKIGSEGGYFSVDDWRACPDLPDDETLKRAPCWIGLDLSSSIDVTAAVLVWKLSEDEFALEPHFWLPKDNLQDRAHRDRVPYPLWVEQQYLNVTDGNTVDLGLVRREVAKLAKAWKVRHVCYDPWHAPEFVQNLKDADQVPVLSIKQSYELLSPATKRLQALILQRRIRHDANPLMTWMIGNAITRPDDKGNVLLSKKRSRGRIDGPQALVNVITQAGAKKPEPQLFFLGGRG